MAHNQEITNEEILERILKELFSFEITSDYKNESFFSSKIGMSARDLLILFMTVQKEFNIIIPEEIVINERLDTFQGLLKSVSKLTCTAK